jgi:uncharacterized membrane protein YbhN (UPF0104 family)
MKKVSGYLLPILLAAFLLWYAYRDQDFSQMFSEFAKASPGAIALTFLTTIFAHWFRALRWNMLFEPLGYQSSKSGSFLAVMSGYFANLLVPRAGEISRCTILSASEDIPIPSAIGTVLAERSFDMLMLLLIALAAFGMEYETLSQFLFRMQDKYSINGGDSSQLKIILVGILAISGLLIYLNRKRLARIPAIEKILGMLWGLIDGLLSVTRLKQPFLFLLYTAFIWGGYYFTTYFSLKMFGFTHDLGFQAAFMLLIVGSFGIVVPVPGAVGGPFQIFVSAALTQLYHKDPMMSITAASMMYWSQVLLSLSGGGLCYLLAIIKANERKKLEKIHV